MGRETAKESGRVSVEEENTVNKARKKEAKSIESYARAKLISALLPIQLRLNSFATQCLSHLCLVLGNEPLNFGLEAFHCCLFDALRLQCQPFGTLILFFLLDHLKERNKRNVRDTDGTAAYVHMGTHLCTG